MYSRHVAYGLELHAAFALPGMQPEHAAELPALRLELSSADEIEAAWSGAGALPAWRGRLGDGSELAIEQGAAGDVLFAHGDHARFRLDGAHELLMCAPLRAGPHWQQALLARVLPNVALLHGYEALHASSVASPAGGVVAIAAPSGAGKTTLALELLDRGWQLFADDVLVLGPGARPGEALAHAGTPHMNLAVDAPVGAASPAASTTLGVLAGERWTALADSSARSSHVLMICMLDRRPGLPLAVQRLEQSPLPLAPYMLGLPDAGGREAQRFARYADLVGSATLVRLTGDPAATPDTLADLLEQALAERSAPLAGALR